jgi:hypothetical protein
MTSRGARPKEFGGRLIRIDGYDFTTTQAPTNKWDLPEAPAHVRTAAEYGIRVPGWSRPREVLPFWLLVLLYQMFWVALPVGIIRLVAWLRSLHDDPRRGAAPAAPAAAAAHGARRVRVLLLPSG